MDINGLEILECKYRVAVTEVIDLKAEIKALKEKYNKSIENYTEEKAKYESKIQMYDEQVTSLEKTTKESGEKMAHIENELQKMTSIANENHNTLNTAQDELVTFSEELAQLYHHVCLCNNETPNRVMLDYYRQSRVTRSGSLKGPDDPRGLLSPRLVRRGHFPTKLLSHCAFPFSIQYPVVFTQSSTQSFTLSLNFKVFTSA